MNPDNPTPPPVPMVKDATVKDDGRLLFYYTFPPEPPQSSLVGEPEQTMPEDTDV